MSIPWEIVVLFTLFVILLILAFAELLSRQTAMARDIKDISEAVHSVARKAGERFATLEALYSGPVCPTVDRRNKIPERRNSDWTVDSDFKGNNKVI